MDDIQQAIEIVRQAEGRLNAIIQQALTGQRYGDVARVADMADTLAQLLQRQQPADASSQRVISVSQHPSNNAPTTAQNAASSTSQIQTRPSRKGDDYPRFERDGDKLVKIGWSKKDRREYEHRAPRDAVFAVAESLQSRIPAGRIFTMEKVLPFKYPDGNEIPSYQSYLALKWFQAISAVEQKGKDGYVVLNGSLSPPRLEQVWSSLPVVD
jgi:hypothetical protein